MKSLLKLTMLFTLTAALLLSCEKENNDRNGSTSSDNRGSSSATLKTDKDSYAAGDIIVVSYEADTVTTSDWVSVFKAGAEDSDYGTYFYNVEAKKSGMGEIVAPSEAGKYNVRYFSGSETENSGVSADFTIE